MESKTRLLAMQQTPTRVKRCVWKEFYIHEGYHHPHINSVALKYLEAQEVASVLIRSESYSKDIQAALEEW